MTWNITCGRPHALNALTCHVHCGRFATLGPFHAMSQFPVYPYKINFKNDYLLSDIVPGHSTKSYDLKKKQSAFVHCKLTNAYFSIYLYSFIIKKNPGPERFR